MKSSASETKPQPLPLLRMTGIGKQFGGVKVLEDIQFEVRVGEVHVLAGENGAGKSTLIKILGGIYSDFEGRIELEGNEIRAESPLHANQLGVTIIHQELSLIGPMSVADNLFLGRMPVRAGFVERRKQEKEAAYWVQQLGLDLDVSQPVERFPMAIRQLIEIAKALSQKAKLIVMDEPTSALNMPEVEKLFERIDSLKRQGCGIVYISHKMEEIERIADRITVLRDGRWIGTAPAAELPVPKLIQWMVGREIGELFPRHIASLGKELFRAEHVSVYPHGLSGRAMVEAVSLSVRSGEILGIGGLQGSGASDLFLGLFGAYGAGLRGSVILNDRKLSIDSPRKAIKEGIALLTNDRKATGLVLSLSIIANATLAALPHLARGGWRCPNDERRAAEKTTVAMRLRAASLDMPVGALSGGNQQKVAIAKWLQMKPKLLLLDEPTRGIDIGAKREIYQLLSEWAAQGMAIMLITSEMPELLTLSDRIMVMHRGRCAAEFSRVEATPEKILAAAMGAEADSNSTAFKN